MSDACDFWQDQSGGVLVSVHAHTLPNRRTKKTTGILAPDVGESASVSAQSQIWLVQGHSFPNRITIAEVCHRQQ